MEMNTDSAVARFRSELDALQSASDALLRQPPEGVRGEYRGFLERGSALNQSIQGDSALSDEEKAGLRAAVFHTLRETSVALNNQKGLTDLALDITRTIKGDFSDLPDLVRRAQEDEAFLRTLPVNAAPRKEAPAQPAQEKPQTPAYSRPSESPAQRVRFTPAQAPLRTAPVQSAPSASAKTPAEPAAAPKAEKKKNRWIVPVIIGVVCLAAAGIAVNALVGGGPASREAVRTATEAIAAIGAPVTVDSRAAIESAQAICDELSEDELARVENVQELYDAQDLLEDVEAAAAMDDEIRAIGEMELDTIDEIERLEGRVEELSPRAQELMEEKELLADKRAEYEEFYAAQLSDGAEYISGLLADGDYLDVLSSATGYEATFPESPYLDDVHGCVADAIISMAEIDFDDGDMDLALTRIDDVEDDYSDVLNTARKNRIAELLDKMAAEQLAIAQEHHDNREYYQLGLALDPFIHYYGDTSSAEEAAALQEELDEWMGSEPSNGYTYHDDISGGYGELTIKNGSSPAVIKVESTSGKYMLFYIKADSNVTVNIKDGDYYVKYASGDTWYSWGDLFGPYTSYTVADEMLEMETTYYSSSISYTTYEITLYRVAGGNLTTTSISEDEF